ncbi:MAG: Os1348 family NHLP clan protein [Ktedonobacterales bacterium]
MLRQDFEQALGRAVCDIHFCTRLLSDPADALTDYGLGTEEATALDGLRAHSLADLAAHILHLANQTVREGKFA